MVKIFTPFSRIHPTITISATVSTANEDYLTYSTRDSNIFSWFVIASSRNLDEYSMLDGEISMVSHPLCQGSGNSSWCLSSMPPMCEDGTTISEINGLISSTVTQSISMNFSDWDLLQE